MPMKNKLVSLMLLKLILSTQSNPINECAIEHPIKHIVVLMMENQSFDKMLGYMSQNAAGDSVGVLADYPPDYFYNYADPRDPGSTKYYVRKKAATNEGRLDPPHEFTNVQTQIYGPSNTTKQMTGFAYDFRQDHTHHQHLDNVTADMMRSYSPHQVPGISTLAYQYVTATNWYSSIPGPTAPNRMFVHCATSGGYAGGRYNRELLKPYYPTMPSIFNVLEDKNKSWRLYYHSDLCTGCALTSLDPYRSDRNHMIEEEKSNFESFYLDLEHGILSDYTFLVPLLENQGDNKANSQHPGDVLIM
eukprot:TRINITY_DN7414_c0_g1_i1.p1 TRINITY_DN7414_c0_g1~~TRINITY_DN7414_c0_g1_i1.p1  ORF type:complete len:303 (-),score=46.67 TRINITY_DN7414_c0_g1_i1:545-1453(-)